MARLIYSAIASLDGCTEDSAGGFGWAEPDEELHAFVNELERPARTHLYGRRMYQALAPWQDVDPEGGGEPAAAREFAAIWQAADKIVYSRTLPSVATSRTRIEREFDPAAVGALKQAAGADITIGGADLAGQAMRAGLVDELHLILLPVIVGGGKRALPGGLDARLGLLSQRRFAGGAVHLHYALRG